MRKVFKGDLDPYPEHNDGYLYECLENLEFKGFLQRAEEGLR